MNTEFNIHLTDQMNNEVYTSDGKTEYRNDNQMV